MSDSILEGLEKDFRLTDFLFFQSTQENNDYMKLISDIRVYVNSPSFKMKYGRKKKFHRTHFSVKTKHGSSKKNFYHCDFCKKDRHTKEYCYSNPESKKYKGKAKDGKPKIQLHTTTVKSHQMGCMKNEVILNSGATNHFFGSRDLFMGPLDSYDGTLECASGNLKIVGRGKVRIESRYSTMIIENVLFVPGLSVNLLSLLKLEDRGVSYECRKGSRKLRHNGRIICDLSISNDLFTLVLMKQDKLTIIDNSKSYNVHSSLGHLSFDKIKHLNIKTDTETQYPCDVCTATKATRSKPKRKFQKPHRHLYELIHSDICEMPIISVDGYKCFALFVDDCSRYCHLSLLRKKSDIYQAFMDLIDNGSFSISTVRSDQGSEYLSKKFQSICIENNIRQEFTSVYTPEERGIAERLNRTLLKKVRPMLFESNLPSTFWSYAVVQANYLYKWSIHLQINKL